MTSISLANIRLCLLPERRRLVKTETTGLSNLIARKPIKAAIRLSRRVGESEINNLSVERENAVEGLTRIGELQSKLLPVERGMIPAIRLEKEAITKRIKQLESFEKLNRYAVFSLEPLTWRNKQGFPRLAVFSLESANFEIAAVGGYNRWGGGGRRWRGQISPKLPKEMMTCYKDVLDKLTKLGRETKKTIRLRTQFGMLIPESVREEISRVRGEFKQIFIVAEAPRWDLKRIAIPKPVDPLVVGYDGICYWLIAAFDPTPLEEYIKKGCIKGS